MALESAHVDVTAPTLTAVWIHDPEDPEATVRQFAYGASGRRDEVSVVGAGLYFVGRTLPMFDFGEHEGRSVSLTLIVPYGDDWSEKIDWLETTLARSRKAWVYRDDRGRLIYGVVLGISLSDEPFGTSVSLTIEATHYDEEV